MAAKLKGTLVQWDDAKGFGFIEPRLPGPRVFVHIGDFARKTPRPEAGLQLVYQLANSADGKQRAVAVVQSRLDGKPLTAQEKPNSGPSKLAPLFTIAFCLMLGAATGLELVPQLVGSICLLMSILTFGLYAWDKKAARAGHWRTAESTLLLAGLLGGWPGAVAAQHWLRHKTVKTSFRARFWATVGLHCCLLLLAYDQHFFGLPYHF
ncbi:DUF1294 domain-containing protein [Rheinheimera texasensis]|uniref:DUF1294 domain-containing protein n=1 Tax=Rheinheimera texasensis TaxID=306205 RepID=UPI00068BFA0A|nr:cold shock and DUF1294 domain-containing protein [Rheinheimera texasensis]